MSEFNAALKLTHGTEDIPLGYKKIVLPFVKK